MKKTIDKSRIFRLVTMFLALVLVVSVVNVSVSRASPMSGNELAQGLAQVSSVTPTPGTVTNSSGDQIRLFELKLTSVGSKKADVTRLVQELTGLSLKQSIDLVEKAPSVIMRNVGYKVVMNARTRFMTAGARVDVYEIPFLFTVESATSIKGRGTLVSGKVERGTVRMGDKVEVVGAKLTTSTVTVIGVQALEIPALQGVSGDSVGLLLQGVSPTDFRSGMVLAKPGSIRAHKSFDLEVYIAVQPTTTNSSGVVSNDLKAQFAVRNVEFPGTLNIPGGLANVTVGKVVPVTVNLSNAAVVEVGAWVEVRMGGRAVAYGTVTKLRD